MKQREEMYRGEKRREGKEEEENRRREDKKERRNEMRDERKVLDRKRGHYERERVGGRGKGTRRRWMKKERIGEETWTERRWGKVRR